MITKIIVLLAACCFLPISCMEEPHEVSSSKSLTHLQQSRKVLCIARRADVAVHKCFGKSNSSGTALYIAPLSTEEACNHCANNTEHCVVKEKWLSAIDLNDSGTRLLIPDNDYIHIYTVGQGTKKDLTFCVDFNREKAFEAVFIGDDVVTLIEPSCLYSYKLVLKGSIIESLEDINFHGKGGDIVPRSDGGTFEKCENGFVCKRFSKTRSSLWYIAPQYHQMLNIGSYQDTEQFFCIYSKGYVIRAKRNGDTISLSIPTKTNALRRAYFLKQGCQLVDLCIQSEKNLWAFGVCEKEVYWVRICKLEENGDLVEQHKQALKDRSFSKIVWPDALSAPYVLSNTGIPYAVSAAWMKNKSDTSMHHEKKRKTEDNAQSLET